MYDTQQIYVVTLCMIPNEYIMYHTICVTVLCNIDCFVEGCSGRGVQWMGVVL